MHVALFELRPQHLRLKKKSISHCILEATLSTPVLVYRCENHISQCADMMSTRFSLVLGSTAMLLSLPMHMQSMLLSLVNDREAFLVSRASSLESLS